jgi:hypothetical protein
MIHFEPTEEPANFDQMVRVPGKLWLSSNPKSDNFPDHWKHCFGALAEGFGHLCGYSAMHVSELGAVVDHYLSKSKHRDLAYEWSNYRYASSKINSRKHTLDDQILDPFEVQDGWFEVQLGSWQLIMTEAIPQDERDRAQFTMDHLQIQTGRDALNDRRMHYRMFLEGQATLAALQSHAPLVYRAVKEALTKLQPFAGEQECYREFLKGHINIHKLECNAPKIAGAVREELPPST